MADESVNKQIAEFYQMRVLEGLNPDDPEAIPELIIGAYIANLRGERQVAEYFDPLLGTDAVARAWLKVPMLDESSKIMDKVGELVGDRTLSVTALNPRSDAIRKKGFQAVLSAVGELDPATSSFFCGPSLGGPTGDQPNSLKLTGKKPGDYYIVRVIDDDYEPQVEFKVVDVDSGSRVKKTARSILRRIAD